MANPPSKDKVCAEFCARFPSYRKDIHNSERVGFMLNHPLIRSKLDEWILTEDNDKGARPSPPLPQSKKNSTNVNNRLIETDPKPLEETHPHSNDRKHLKNPTHSLGQRELGNTLYKQKKLYESLAAYNEAIRHAPTHSNGDETSQIPEEKELFSLSLANRSAVYFELGERFYEKSLVDANLALKTGYPDRLKSKLLVRKANIYVKLKKWSRAEATIQEIQDLMHDSTFTQHLHPDLLNKVKEIEGAISQSNKCDEEDNGVHPLHSAAGFEENANFVNASTMVDLNHSDEAQRFVVAATDLKKRDVVFNEEPFASVLLPQFYESHCHHCHELLEHSHFIPCQQCSQCKFCSEGCATNAWNIYHQYECTHLDFLHSIGIAHLAIRIIFCAGLQNILDAFQDHQRLTDAKNISIFQKRGSNYERTYSLLDHSDDMNPEDMFQYTLTAALLTNWMVKKTSFFDEHKETCQDGASNSAMSVQIGAVLLRHICQLICNGHAITAILTDINVDKVSLSTADESQQRIATAIFPAASMMNHSCDPNIAFTFKKGKTLQVKLTEDVEKGQEIFNCYGPHFRRMPVSVRQESLNDQYFFQCKCHHCIEESVHNFSFVDTFSSFKCEECEGPVPSPPNTDGDQEFYSSCRFCGHKMDLQDSIRACVYADRLVQDAEVLLERGNVNQALPMFRTCEDQYQGFLYKYNSTFGQLTDVIGRCYAVVGEFTKAADFVKKSLNYVQERFGPESIEYAREIKKYVDLRSRSKVIADSDELKQLSELYQSILL